MSAKQFYLRFSGPDELALGEAFGSAVHQKLLLDGGQDRIEILKKREQVEEMKILSYLKSRILFKWWHQTPKNCFCFALQGFLLKQRRVKSKLRILFEEINNLRTGLL